MVLIVHFIVVYYNRRDDDMDNSHRHLLLLYCKIQYHAEKRTFWGSWGVCGRGGVRREHVAKRSCTSCGGLAQSITALEFA